MSLKDWPPFGANRETMAEWNERRRKEDEELQKIYNLRIYMWTLIIFIVFLLISGCAVSEQTLRAAKIADQQGCLYTTGSYLQCPHTPEMVR